MPEAEQAEDIPSELAREEAIHFVQPPHDWRGDFYEHLTTQVPPEVDARALRREPCLGGRNVQFEWVGDRLGSGRQQFLGRLHLGVAEALKVRDDNFGASLARLLKAARQQ
jgi:hypothetical protein